MNELEVVDAMPIVQQITKGEMETQIEIARKYPRELTKVREDVLTLATLDQETAQDCFYSLPRGGKAITGESVRLAEILASCYGHLRAGARPLAVDLNRGVVTVQGVCTDVEKNFSATVEKTRKIQKKRNADTYDEDMITLATNAACAIAYRDAVFKVVPKALIKPILSNIREAARGKGTLEQKRKTVVDRLVEMGIAEKSIYSVMNIKCIEDITLPILDTLIGMGTAIKNGEYTKDDLFPKVTIEKPNVSGAGKMMGKEDDVPMESESEKQEATEKKQKSEATKVMKLFKGHGISEELVVAWSFANKHCDANTKKVSQMSIEKIKLLSDNVEAIVKDILPPSE
jgi:hypothetical protein